MNIAFSVKSASFAISDFSPLCLARFEMIRFTLTRSVSEETTYLPRLRFGLVSHIT